jgi:ankyrin repeat protein
MSTGSRLLDAIIGGREEEALLVISSGVDVNIVGPRGATPLIFASIGGMKRVINELLGKGANIQAIDNDGNTALMHACMAKHEDTALLLLNANADILEPRGPLRRTPLQAAASEGLNLVVEFILQILRNQPSKIAYLDYKDVNGKTATEIAQRKRAACDQTNISLIKKYNNIIEMIHYAKIIMGGKRKRSHRQKRKSRKSRKARK